MKTARGSALILKSLMFSQNTSVQSKDEVKVEFGINSENWNDRYVGLPVHVGRSRRKVFGYMKKNLCGRMHGWQERLLAKTSKETLPKAVG